MHLNAEINWHQEFEKLIKGFNMNRLDTKQNSLITKSEK